LELSFFIYIFVFNIKLIHTQMNLKPEVKFNILGYILTNFHKIKKLEVNKKPPSKGEYIKQIAYNKNNEISVFTDKRTKAINDYDWMDMLWMKSLMVKYLKKQNKELSIVKGHNGMPLFKL